MVLQEAIVKVKIIDNILKYSMKQFSSLIFKLKNIALSYYKNFFQLNHRDILLKNNQTNLQNHSSAIVEKYRELAKTLTISVVIPVKNGGQDLRLLLGTIQKQTGFAQIELIIVDSGSTDNSVETASKMGAQVMEILPQDFSHSYARNKGAEIASGDYILFTVQDALLPDENWLLECFSKMKANGAVAVSCIEFMKEDADLFYRVCSWNHNMFMGVTKGDRILSKPRTENYLGHFPEKKYHIYAP